MLYLGQQAEERWDAHKLPVSERLVRQEELLRRGAECGVPESINHVLQHRFITSDTKTARYNASLRHLSGVL